MRILRRRRRQERTPSASTGPPCDVDVSAAGSTTTVTISGEMDIATAPRVRAALSSPAVAECEALVVDLDGVTFIDSSGLALLLALQRDLQARGGRLAITCPEGPARLLFDVTGADAQLPLFPSREAAVAAVGSPPPSA